MTDNIVHLQTQRIILLREALRSQVDLLRESSTVAKRRAEELEKTLAFDDDAETTVCREKQKSSDTLTPSPVIWYSPENRLPNKGEIVIVYHGPNFRPATAMFKGRDKLQQRNEWVWTSGGRMRDEPLKWTPLPDPPANEPDPPLPPQSPWISENDKLPEHWDHVLVAHCEGDAGVPAFFDYAVNQWYWATGAPISNKPIYWRPMKQPSASPPQAPQQQKPAPAAADSPVTWVSPKDHLPTSYATVLAVHRRGQRGQSAFFDPRIQKWRWTSGTTMVTEPLYWRLIPVAYLPDAEWICQ